MDVYLTFLTLYALGCILILPPYFYWAYKRRQKKANEKDSNESIPIGYAFWADSLRRSECHARYMPRWEAVALADKHANDFLNMIRKDYWLKAVEYEQDNLQKCDTFEGQEAGFTKLSMIMEHEVRQYDEAMRYRHDDGKTLKEAAVNEAVDVLLFTTACRTFETQLNLIEKEKALEIYDFCMKNLSFLDPKYESMLTMDPTVTGLRRTEQ